nr:apolipoprotein N-acyltransferase [Rhodoferax sp.]
AIWVQAPMIARRFWMPVMAASVAGIMVWAPHSYSEAAGKLRVALLQGNIPQDQKFQAGTGVIDALRWYGEQMATATAPLVVAPETAIPLLPRDLPADYWASLRQRYSQGSQAALFGIPLVGTQGDYTNSVVGLRPGDAAANEASNYRYDKHHLVPFGEFIPPLFRWFTEMMNIPLGDFSRGQVGQPSFEWKGQRLAPNICYEDLFGEELAQRFADPEQAPTVFVNVSNIGWFGNTVAIDQHLNISRMRALEFERPFIRATNTGETAIIDHRGQVTDSLARLTRGVLQGEVQGRTGLTPFAWWASRFGLWPLWLAGTSAVAIAWIVRRRRLRRYP